MTITPSVLEQDFEPLNIEDWAIVEEYIQRCQYEESNHNIINMMMWLDAYPLFFCKHPNYLILLGIHEGKFFMYMPLCEKQYIEEALLKAKSIFDHYEQEFTLSCFTKEMVDEVIHLFPQYVAIEERDAADYVYGGDQLRTYSGKKMQKKRNHLNAFYKEYEGRWAYESFNEQNVQECIEYLKTWKPDDEDEFLASEKVGVEMILKMFGKLPYRGGVIRIDGKVEAFAIGSHLSANMAQENIEKATGSIRGLYQCIMKEMLAHEFAGYAWINREDDTGRQNLRDAKLSYHPAYLIAKYRIKKQA